MKKYLPFILCYISITAHAQGPLLQPGNHFPEITISNISNAPVKEFRLAHTKDSKWYILNFWGTWCSPCIPEMDVLAKLQKANAGKLQVIAISDDSEERKKKYLSNKPSSIWLATDTSYTLYKMLNLAYVGQSAIVDPSRKIVTLVRTDSINQAMIDRLLKGEPVRYSAETMEAAIQTKGDPFGLDSLTEHSFTIRGYKTGERTMGRTYADVSEYKGRRLSWYNVTPGLLYRAAYGIKTYMVQEFFDSTSLSAAEIAAFKTHNTKDRGNFYCVDLLVKPGQKDSLYYYLQQYLNAVLPVKAKKEQRKMEVLVLKQQKGIPLAISISAKAESSYGFSGRGITADKISLDQFAEDYLSNELGLPVVNETGLQGFYNITTNVEQRDYKGIIRSVEALGLTVEKAERVVPVIIYYK